MEKGKVFLRCPSCRTVNRVNIKRIASKPLCGSCKSPLPAAQKPVDSDEAGFYREVLSWPGLVLVDFWSPHCGYCMRMNPILDELARQKAGILKIVKINTLNEQNLAAQLQIRGVPAFFLFENGTKLGEFPGAGSQAQLENCIHSLVPNYPL